ncbi:hypothetical protein OIV83_004661 [Microbotryomycetes sp. JL201]|nr:hypothetical protein OIV83_004661 [Microbotryomycetes sp. JL201]
MSLGSCCISGFKHEGTPRGNKIKFGETPVYEALPKGDYDKTKALLLLPDAFGNELNNGLLLADSFADEGFATYSIDYLNGDPVPENGLNDPNFDLGKWIGKHGADVTRPHIDNVMKALKDKGVTTLAASGFCFGGRYVADLVIDDQLKTAIVNHPSLLKFPDDAEKIKSHSVPFLWNTCETDFMMGPEQQKIADEVFKGDKNYTRKYWAGVSHGWSIRGDPNDATVKKAMDEAFEASIKHLKETF